MGLNDYTATRSTTLGRDMGRIRYNWAMLIIIFVVLFIFKSCYVQYRANV